MADSKAWWETVKPAPPWNAPGSAIMRARSTATKRTMTWLDISRASDVQTALTAFLADFSRTETRIHSDDADGPVAAACLVAVRLSGRVLDDHAEQHLEETPFVVTEDLRALAAAVLDRVVRPGDNEYREWYDDDPEACADWLGQLAWYRASLA